MSLAFFEGWLKAFYHQYRGKWRSVHFHRLVTKKQVQRKC